jgi:hypothetical protein
MRQNPVLVRRNNVRIPSLFIHKHVSFVDGEMLTLLGETCRRINQQTSNTVQQDDIDTL